MSNVLCQVCNKNTAIERHHLFSQTKANRKLYPEHIHNELNLIKICGLCHHFKVIPKYTEIEFCKVMGIEPRSYSGMEIWKRLKED